MIDHRLVLVGFEPDWEALYVEGKKVAEGHRVHTWECVKHSMALAEKLGTTDICLESTHVEANEGNEYEEHDICERLEDLPAGALSRISR